MEVKEESFEKLDILYSELPWYRKRWFLVVSLLFFSPACLIIALTGDIYAQIDGDSYKYTEKQKKTLIFVSIFLLLMGLFRAVIS